MDDAEDIRIGRLVLNRVRGCLEDEKGAERFLRAKSYRVLEVLCRRQGELVSKDELIEYAWPGLFVTDDSLAHCVSDIRNALGPTEARLLRTVARRGYILDAGDVAAGPRSRKSISTRAAWIGCLALLVSICGILWAAFREPAQHRGPVAVTALIQADALLEARDWRRRGDNEKARRLLEQVVADNPRDAAALASLALTYWLEVRHLAWGGGRREMESAVELIELSVAAGGSDRSLRLLAEMRLFAPFRDLRSPVDALASARAAVAIDPKPDNLVVLAQALALTGRPMEAIGLIEQALRLEPNPPDWHRFGAGLSYLLAGEPARAVEELGPLYGAGTFANERWWPGWLFVASLAHAGRIDDAARVVDAATGTRPERTVQAVAQSLDGLSEEGGLRLVLDGLRLAGIPG